MNRFVAFLFGPTAFPAFSRLVAALLAPMLRSFALDYDTLRLVLGHVAAQTAPATGAGGYSMADLAAMVTDIDRLLGLILVEYRLAGLVTEAQVSRLLEAVAEQAAKPAAAP